MPTPYSATRSKVDVLQVAIALLFLFLPSFACAQDCSDDGTGLCTYINVGQTTDITTPFTAYDGLTCHEITNNCANPANNQLMVPFSTAGEWNSFLQSLIATSSDKQIKCVDVAGCLPIAVTLTPSQSSLPSGQAVTLSWTITGYNGTLTCTPSSNDGSGGGNGSWPASGEPLPITNPNSSYAVIPLAAAGGAVSYRLSCTDSKGGAGSGSAMVFIQNSGGGGGGDGCVIPGSGFGGGNGPDDNPQPWYNSSGGSSPYTWQWSAHYCYAPVCDCNNGFTCDGPAGPQGVLPCFFATGASGQTVNGVTVPTGTVCDYYTFKDIPHNPPMPIEHIASCTSSGWTGN